MFSLPAMASKTPGFGFKASLGSRKAVHSWSAFRQLASALLPISSSLEHGCPVWAGVPNLQDLMPRDLGWSCCKNSRHKAHNKCTPDSSTEGEQCYIAVQVWAEADLPLIVFFHLASYCSESILLI